MPTLTLAEAAMTIAVLAGCMMLVVSLCTYAFQQRRSLRRWNDRNRSTIAPAGNAPASRSRRVRWFPRTG